MKDGEVKIYREEIYRRIQEEERRQRLSRCEQR
jgi:sRNA-binding carbon storage regulator CsrA